MNRVARITALILPIFAASDAIAAMITTVNIAGGYTVWEADSNGVLSDIGSGTPPLADYLQGTAGAPGDNIEVANNVGFANWQGGTFSTLSGDLGSLRVEISSLTQADWSANGNALAYAYVNDALESLGKTSGNWDPNALPAPFPPTTFDEAVTAFVFGTPLAPEGGAYAISDPNVAYVSSVTTPGGSTEVSIGLQGNFNANAVVGGLLPFVGLSANDVEAMASEVALVNIFEGAGGPLLFSDYLYTFSATATNQVASDCPGGTTSPFDPTCSYTGNYEVKAVIPSPPVTALVCLGIAAITAVRRRTAARS